MTESAGARRQWVRPAVLTVAVLAVYVLGVFPLRHVVAQRLTMPLLTAIDTPRAARITVTLNRDGRNVQFWPEERGAFDPADEETTHRLRPFGAPLLLVGVLALIWLEPRRPWWLVLVGADLGLWVLRFGLAAVGVAWSPWGFGAVRVLQNYVGPGLALAWPLLLFVGRRLRRKGRGPDGREGD